ncbi:TetR/AcrR family transcriptional regulator [Leptolyngbya sp. BC1307]|uniref:TetR/AcrR family transcriptional regulator n=1 Tax=Leptolyngbya sp. BC1307 TaxID=2029589 RepID=UPI000EFACD87|nr:TetR/AcrR family transcriptional regulator [Leptolyngbya sp. BC1307]
MKEAIALAKPILQKIAETTALTESTQKPRYDIEGRYQALLEAGETLLCEGYDQAQPKRIAELAGVSVGLFYKHFSSKRDLLAAVMVHRLGSLHSLIEDAIASEPSPERSLKAVIVQTLAYFQKHRGLAKLFFMQIGYGDHQATEQLSSNSKFQLTDSACEETYQPFSEKWSKVHSSPNPLGHSRCPPLVSVSIAC